MDMHVGVLHAVNILRIHLLGDRGHIDLRTGTDDDILQGLVVTEVIHTRGGHQHCPDIPLLDDLSDILVGIEHRLTHQGVVFHLL